MRVKIRSSRFFLGRRLPAYAFRHLLSTAVHRLILYHVNLWLSIPIFQFYRQFSTVFNIFIYAKTDIVPRFICQYFIYIHYSISFKCCFSKLIPYAQSAYRIRGRAVPAVRCLHLRLFHNPRRAPDTIHHPHTPSHHILH